MKGCCDVVGGSVTLPSKKERLVTRVNNWDHWFTGLGAGTSVVGSRSPLTLNVLETSISPGPR